MRRGWKYILVGVLLTATLGLVWADDYVDDVYYWGETTTTTTTTTTTGTAEAATITTTETADAASQKIEFLPQTNDTTVVIRIKK